MFEFDQMAKRLLEKIEKEPDFVKKENHIQRILGIVYDMGKFDKSKKKKEKKKKKK